MAALSEGAGSGAFAVAGGGTSRYGPEESQFVRVLLPPGAGVHPTVFVVHGGFWKNKYTVANGATETLAPWLVRRGYAVVVAPALVLRGGRGVEFFLVPRRELATVPSGQRRGSPVVTE